MRACCLAILLPLLSACSGPDKPQTVGAASAPSSPSESSTGGEPASTRSPDPSTAAPRIVFLGDSLTAGLGLPPEQSFPALIQARLRREGYAFEVVNAGVSGDTSAGGLRRLTWALDGNVRVLVVALGGNDGLRGLAPAQLKKNLASVIEAGLARGLTVLLAGMEAPPNNGPEYTAAFRAVYASLAREYDVLFVPFLLEGIAGDASLNQADGIHPNPRGAERMADLVWRTLEPALRQARAAS